MTSGDILPTENSGDILTGDDTTIPENPEETGNTTNPDELTGDIKDPTNPIPEVLSIDEVLADATKLASEAKKTLIKATIAKNTALRTTVFYIQKQVNELVQELANTTDMSILNSKAELIVKLRESLESINIQLDGNAAAQ